MSKEKSYSEKFKDPRWQKLRLKILERDNWRCNICGKNNNTLHVHHLFYKEWGTDPWDYPSDSLLTLCDKCHEKEHSLYKAKIDKAVKNIMGTRATNKILYEQFFERIERIINKDIAREEIIKIGPILTSLLFAIQKVVEDVDLDEHKLVSSMDFHPLLQEDLISIIKAYFVRYE